jgi:hypothetical protein
VAYKLAPTTKVSHRDTRAMFPAFGNLVGVPHCLAKVSIVSYLDIKVAEAPDT